MNNKYINRPEAEGANYKYWRYAVYKRDGFCCQMPGCQNKKNLEAHHIVKFASAVNLRYSVKNGITLCKNCHDIVTGREEQYRDKFNQIVASKKIMTECRRQFPKGKYKPRNPRLRYG